MAILTYTTMCVLGNALKGIRILEVFVFRLKTADRAMLETLRPITVFQDVQRTNNGQEIPVHALKASISLEESAKNVLLIAISTILKENVCLYAVHTLITMPLKTSVTATQGIT